MVRSPDGDDENRTTAVFVRAERPSLIPKGPGDRSRRSRAAFGHLRFCAEPDC